MVLLVSRVLKRQQKDDKSDGVKPQLGYFSPMVRQVQLREADLYARRGITLNKEISNESAEFYLPYTFAY